MSAAEAMAWAAEVGPADLSAAPPITAEAAGLLARADFPISSVVAGTHVRPPVPATAGDPLTV